MRKRTLVLLLWLGLAGAATLAWCYAEHPGEPTNYVVFWAGVVGVLLSGASVGMLPGSGDRVRIGTLLAVGAVLWLPYYLRSPGQLIFEDELFHWQVLQYLAATGHANAPVTLFPIPGAYPALEYVTDALHLLSGGSLLATTRVVTLGIHTALPAIAYVAFRGIGLRARQAFVGALTYMANTSFYWFNAIFAYETLGILLFLTLVAFSARVAAEDRSPADIAAACVVAAGIAFTHHLTAILFAVFSIVFVAITLVGKRKLTKGQVILTVWSVVSTAGWLAWRGHAALAYLYYTFTARASSVYAAAEGATGARRTLFTASSLPTLEQALDKGYPAVILLLISVGAWTMVRRGRWRVTPIYGVLFVFGPICWVASLALIPTASSDVAYRLWPFLFIGVGVAVALTATSLNKKARLPVFRKPVWGAFLVVALVFVIGTGMSLGDNEAGRFQTASPPQAAGPASTTNDEVSAALWLLHRAGPLNVVVGDENAETVFATYGDQRAISNGEWTPYLARDAHAVVSYLHDYHVNFLVVDLRDSQRLPRYGVYFLDQAPYQLPSWYKQSKPFPKYLLTKFQAIPELNKIYDNGSIQIYQVVRDAGR